MIVDHSVSGRRHKSRASTMPYPYLNRPTRWHFPHQGNIPFDLSGHKTGGYFKNGFRFRPIYRHYRRLIFWLIFRDHWFAWINLMTPAAWKLLKLTPASLLAVDGSHEVSDAANAPARFGVGHTLRPSRWIWSSTDPNSSVITLAHDAWRGWWWITFYDNFHGTPRSTEIEAIEAPWKGR